MKTIDLTTVVKNLNGDNARIELERYQTPEGQTASRQRDMLLSDVLFSTLGNANVSGSTQTKALMELVEKAHAGGSFSVNEDEFKVIYSIFQMQKFYLKASFINMINTLNNDFDLAAYEDAAVAAAETQARQ